MSLLRNCLVLRLQAAVFLPVAVFTAVAPATDRLPRIALPELPGPTAFTLPSEADRSAARKEVCQQVDAIEKSLALLPVGEFVRSVTGLDQLKSIIGRDGSVSAAELQPIIDRLSTGADHLDEPRFLQLRQTLVRYQRTLTAVDAGLAELYAVRRADLQQSWIDYQYGSSDEALSRLRQNYAWCVNHRQAEPECRVIRDSLDRGNVILKLDRQQLAALLPGTTRQNVPIATVSDGTAIQGNGILVIKPRLVLLPNSKVGDMQIVLDGLMNASMTANRGRIQAWMQSTALLASTARMTLDGSTLKFQHQPASRASSWTSASAVRPPLNLPLVRRVTGPVIRNVVNRQLAENKGQMDAMIAQQMSQIITTEAKKMCEQVNRTYDEAFFTHFRRHGLSPEVRASTTTESLSLAYSFSDGDDLAGLPPTSATASDLMVHESYLLGVGRMYAGKRLDAEGFRESVFEAIGLLPGDDTAASQGDAGPTVTLASQSPLRVNFRDRRWTFEVNASRVERAGQKYEGSWTMRGEYTVASVGSTVVLKRNEPATVTSHSTSQVLTAADADRFFPSTLQFSEFTGPGQMLKSASLAISGVSLDGGWMRIDLQPATNLVASSKTADLATKK